MVINCVNVDKQPVMVDDDEEEEEEDDDDEEEEAKEGGEDFFRSSPLAFLLVPLFPLLPLDSPLLRRWSSSSSCSFIEEAALTATLLTPRRMLGADNDQANNLSRRVSMLPLHNNNPTSCPIVSSLLALSLNPPPFKM